jgi:hypothetical protein
MEEDLRSSGAGLRGFKSHPRHHCVKNTGVHFLANPLSIFGKLLFRSLTVFSLSAINRKKSYAVNGGLNLKYYILKSIFGKLNEI